MLNKLLRHVLMYCKLNWTKTLRGNLKQQQRVKVLTSSLLLYRFDDSGVEKPKQYTFNLLFRSIYCFTQYGRVRIAQAILHTEVAKSLFYHENKVTENSGFLCISKIKYIV